MSIPRQHFINKIKEMECFFDGFQRNTDMWRKRGTTIRIALPRNDMLDDLFVRTALVLAECTEEEAEEFIRLASR